MRAVLPLAVIILLIPVVLIELPVLQHSHGDILLPQDTAFLNLAVARNLAFHTVWGVSKYVFQPATTSLLYPIVIAIAFFIFGAHLVIPVIVNLIAAVYFLLMLQKTLIRYGLSPLKQLLTLIAAMTLTLLPLLVVSGMEYVLQLLCVFLFLDAVSTNSRRIYLYSFLAVATRYEDLIIIALACLLLTRRKQEKTAIKLALIATSPIILFGLISLLKKSPFLPDSLLELYPVYAVVLAILATTVAAWLIIRQPNIPKFVAIILLIIPFTIRNANGLTHFQRDCNKIYDQQFLTAGFVHLYYFKSTVGTNEPGAVSYFSEGRKLDYTNLWSPLLADSLSRRDGVRAAIVADPWLDTGLLPNWKKIASWNIPGAATVAGKKITFYAINHYDTTRLRRYLHEYQPHLPPTVSVQYY